MFSHEQCQNKNQICLLMFNVASQVLLSRQTISFNFSAILSKGMLLSTVSGPCRGRSVLLAN